MWGYGPDYGMMGGYGSGYGMMGGFGMIIWVIVLIAIVVAVVWFVRAPNVSGITHGSLSRRSSGLEVLEERYARGEIGREEYLQKKQDIER